MSFRKCLRSLAIAIVLAGCGGGSPDTLVVKAEAQLAAGAYSEAVAAADAGLAANPQDAAIRWRLEFARLEALARSGDVAGSAETLERLASIEGTMVRASHYASTADQLKAAGQGAGAIEVLDKGLKRHPEDPDLAKALEQAKATGDDEVRSALESLGYLGNTPEPAAGATEGAEPAAGAADGSEPVAPQEP